MPSPSLIEAFEKAKRRHSSAVDDLTHQLVSMALSTVAEALPGAASLETEGQQNEDWLCTLRIIRVMGKSGEVLFDVAAGHEQAEIESLLDEVGTDYLDLLLDLTGEEYLGIKMIVSSSDDGFSART